MTTQQFQADTLADCLQKALDFLRQPGNSAYVTLTGCEYDGRAYVNLAPQDAASRCFRPGPVAPPTGFRSG